jgi:AraC-like DNA-binding protein
MNAAKELLRDPFLAAADVAGMVGYESPNYFTRAFKKNTGMTPTEYRRSLAASAGKEDARP